MFSRSAKGFWSLTIPIGLSIGVALMITAFSLQFFTHFFIEPAPWLMGAVIAVAAMAVVVGFLYGSFRRGTLFGCAVVLGLLLSFIPPIDDVVRTAYTWIAFAQYKSTLDRAVDSARPRLDDSVLVKITVSGMFLMSNGFAYFASGKHNSSGEDEMADRLASALRDPCVHVHHLFGNYYAWDSSCG